jgi:hypothetical protein
MKEWTEEEYSNKNLLAPCGLYCGVCGVYISNRDNDIKFRKVLARLYGSKPEDTKCLGCMQKEPIECIYGYCKKCEIRSCIQAKNFYSCHQCSDFPCSLIENFIIPVGKRVMKRAIPKWKELVERLGDEKGSIEWARSECEHYHCPDCGAPLFRGAVRCRNCRAEVASRLDGIN